MAKEQSKAVKRRFYDPMYHTKYYKGHGIDIGCGDDSLKQYIKFFPLLSNVDEWDLPQGDAQIMPGVKDNTYDFVTSSHCLEHLNNPVDALKKWIDITKKNGHILVAIPDFELYERKMWPSRFNSQHNHFFDVTSVMELLLRVKGRANVIRLNRIEDFWDPLYPGDQTKLPNTECAIEFVLRKC